MENYIKEGEALGQAWEQICQKLNHSNNEIIATIVDDSLKSSGAYTVESGSLKFVAYCGNGGTYYEGDQVRITIPNNQWESTKFIEGKYVTPDSAIPITYTDPLKTMSAIDTISEFKLWRKYENETLDFNEFTEEGLKYPIKMMDTLCIDTSFQTNLPDDWNTPYYLCLTLTFVNIDGTEEKQLIKISSAELFGNPYKFVIPSSQRWKNNLVNTNESEKFLSKIEAKLDADKLDTNYSTPYFCAIYADVKLHLGIDAEKVESKTLSLFLDPDSNPYSLSYSKDDSNNDSLKRILKVAWFNKNDKGENIGFSDSDYVLYWFRFDSLSGATDTDDSTADNTDDSDADNSTADNIGGLGWVNIQKESISKVDKNSSEYQLPAKSYFDYTKTEKELFKAVLQDSTTGTYYTSNILEFTNLSQEEITKEIIKYSNTLSIVHGDNSQEEYYIYNGNSSDFGLIDWQEARTERIIYPIITKAQVVEEGEQQEVPFPKDVSVKVSWQLPSNEYSMIRIVPDGTWKEKNGWLINTITGTDWTSYGLKYYIRESCPQGQVSNTIKCKIQIGNVLYSSETTIHFGIKGSNGTEYTLIATPIEALNEGEARLKIQLLNLAGEALPLTTALSLEAEQYGYMLSTNPTSTLEEDEKDNTIWYCTVDEDDINEIGCLVEISTFVLIANDTTSNSESTTSDSEEEKKKARSVRLSTTCSIPYKADSDYSLSGPINIAYNAFGTNPVFLRKPYTLTPVPGEGEQYVYSINSQDATSSVSQDVTLSIRNELIPPAMFLENLMKDKVYIQVKHITSEGENLLWSQPLIFTRNEYSNAIVNRWDGNLYINKEANAVLAAMLGAGEKNGDNEFSGALMGKVQFGSDSKFGLFGYREGNMTFGFQNNGTGFIGSDGAGRIEFDGSNSIIKGASFDDKNNASGVQINLGTEPSFCLKKGGTELFKVDGGEALLQSINKNISLNLNNDAFEVKIGEDEENKVSVINITKNSTLLQSANEKVKLNLSGNTFTLESDNLTVSNEAFIFKIDNTELINFELNNSDESKSSCFIKSYNYIESTDESEGNGMYIDLTNGTIDAYNFKLTSGNIEINSNPDAGEDYFSVSSLFAVTKGATEEDVAITFNGWNVYGNGQLKYSDNLDLITYERLGKYDIWGNGSVVSEVVAKRIYNKSESSINYFSTANKYVLFFGRGDIQKVELYEDDDNFDPENDDTIKPFITVDKDIKDDRFFAVNNEAEIYSPGLNITTQTGIQFLPYFDYDNIAYGIHPILNNPPVEEGKVTEYWENLVKAPEYKGLSIGATDDDLQTLIKNNNLPLIKINGNLIVEGTINARDGLDGALAFWVYQPGYDESGNFNANDTGWEDVALCTFDKGNLIDVKIIPGGNLLNENDTDAEKSRAQIAEAYEAKYNNINLREVFPNS